MTTSNNHDLNLHNLLSILNNIDQKYIETLEQTILKIHAIKNNDQKLKYEESIVADIEEFGARIYFLLHEKDYKTGKVFTIGD